MAYDPIAVANKFLSLARDEGKSLTHMHIQKLVFYAHAYYLAIEDEPLIDAEIGVWDYGPVIEKMYHEFKNYGGQPIPDPGFVVSGDLPEEDKAVDLIKQVWNSLKDYTAIQLSNATHGVGEPWSIAKENGSAVIDNESIKKVFSKRITS